MEVTALTLVNRLLRRHRMDDVSVFTSAEAKLALDLINTSIRDLMSERDYPWNVRFDGELHTKPDTAGTAFTALTGNSGFADTSITSVSNLVGDWVTRVVIGDSTLTGYAATAFRVVSARVNTGTLLGTFTAAWPLDNAVAVSAKYLIYEYVLPDTVQKVISVRHEKRPIKLMEIDPNQSFDEVFPRHWENDSGEPMVVAVGGQAEATYNGATATAGRVGLRLMIWPTPLDALVLSYTYKERVTELEETTDSIKCPDEFADDIVNRAEMYSYANAFGNDPDLAALQQRIGSANAAMKYGNSRLDPQRRHVVNAIDNGTRRPTDPTSYRNITGL